MREKIPKARKNAASVSVACRLFLLLASNTHAYGLYSQGYLVVQDGCWDFNFIIVMKTGERDSQIEVDKKVMF